MFNYWDLPRWAPLIMFLAQGIGLWNYILQPWENVEFWWNPQMSLKIWT